MRARLATWFGLGSSSPDQQGIAAVPAPADNALSAFRSPTLPLHPLPPLWWVTLPLNVVENSANGAPHPYMPRQKKGKARQQGLVPEGGGGEGDLGV